MCLSISSKLRHGVARIQIWKALSWRSLKLFIIGMFMNNGANLKNWRLLGVLQYFGTAGFILATIVTWVPRKSNNIEDGQMRDVLPFLFQWLVALSLLCIYLMLQYITPLPDGCPTGYTGPGGIGDEGKYVNCTGGAHRAIDIAIWGEHHIYHSTFSGNVPSQLAWYFDQGILPRPAIGAPISAATCTKTYGCSLYDPEGTLGMLTATFMSFLGFQAGRILTTFQDDRSRIVRFIAWGVFISAIATALCGGTKFTGAMPISKNLWSPSFIFC